MSLYYKVIEERNNILLKQTKDNLSDVQVNKMINEIIVEENGLKLMIDENGIMTAQTARISKDLVKRSTEDKSNSFRSFLDRVFESLKLNF